MTFKYLPCALLVLALSACKPDPTPVAAAPSPAPAAPAAPAPAPGVVQQTAEIPQLQVPTVDGKTYDLASHRGQWVVVNFWATWCAPCLQEMPELSALHAMRSNVEVVGLAYEDIELDEMQAFLKEHPVAYPIAIIDTFSPPKDFATPRGLPMTYLIGPDGKVARQFLGPVNAREVEEAITAAGGKAV
ncbi:MULTISPECIES: TlpA disulfide reductase family protein [Stenotrophomonas]|uniref:TlpA family protein disulfide reductase n=1 Tax=Stenotrophomonas TaxID=40323 RepID=UPI00076FF835|nr:MULTISPECIES: TlpA disulfide reductase family protein [Stenotrophomonas]AMJ57564.1 thioredoxin [Stenotrophomonas sp. KCTC 12332]